MRRWQSMPRLGWDLGGVIIDNDAIDPRTGIRYPKHHPDIPEVEGAGDSIAHLSFLGVLNFIITSGKPNVDERRKTWLLHPRYGEDNFYEHTSIPPWNVRFCRERTMKLVYCKGLKIRYFVDNRADVLASLVGVVPRLYLFGPHPVTEGVSAEVLQTFERAENHKLLLPILLRDIDADREEIRKKRHRLYGMTEAE